MAEAMIANMRVASSMIAGFTTSLMFAYSMIPSLMIADPDVANLTVFELDDCGRDGCELVQRADDISYGKRPQLLIIWPIRILLNTVAVFHCLIERHGTQISDKSRSRCCIRLGSHSPYPNLIHHSSERLAYRTTLWNGSEQTF